MHFLRELWDNVREFITTVGSVALFFGGVSTKLTSQTLRVVVVSIGCLVFLGTMVWVASFPVSLSI